MSTISIQDQERYSQIMNNQTYLTQEEYDFCFNINPSEVRTSTSYIGDYSKSGAYLNFNVYSEVEKEKRDLAIEQGF
jgi:mannose-1-phosphate guanylyltransferase